MYEAAARRPVFDTPIDAWYVWIGVSAASLAVLGVATALPATPAPDAPAAAETVDRIAASDHDATASHPLDADSIRIGPRRIGLRNDAGAAHATLGYRVVPVVGETRLVGVLRGAPVASAFPTRASFRRAVAAARERDPRFRPAGAVLVVRHLSWGETEVTLVGTTDGSGVEGVAG
jgi:hypothetical protein